MISFILPFYHKADLFKATARFNPAFWEQDTEVVCVIDHPSDEKPVLDLTKICPEIKWKVIVNDQEHDWRPPCVPYNVGIRHASGTHVVLFDPESIVMLPYARYLHNLAADNFQWAFAGMSWHVPDPLVDLNKHSILIRCLRAESITAPAQWGYGFLMAPRYDLAQIHGYDESRKVYGDDDDDIRKRLSRYGVPCLVDPLIKCFHLWHDNPTCRIKPGEPTKAHVSLTEQKETWGKEYGRVAYDWSLPPMIEPKHFDDTVPPFKVDEQA